MKTMWRQILSWAGHMVGLVIVGLVLLNGRAQAQCDGYMENMAVSTNKSKCGNTELCGNVSSPPKYYLKKIHTEKWYYFNGYCDGSLEYGNPHFECEGETKESYNTVTTEITDHLTCGTVVQYLGSYILSSFGGACVPNASSYDVNASLNSDGNWSDGVDRHDLFSRILLTNTTCTATLQVDEHHYSDTTGCNYPNSPPFIQDEVIKTTLSMEYTDGMLRGDVEALMSAYPTNWSEGTGHAFYKLSSDHVDASGGKMKYRLKVPDSIKKAKYLLEWNEVTTDAAGHSSSVKQQETITGTGDPTTPAYGTVHEVAMPSEVSDIREMKPILIKVTYN